MTHVDVAVIGGGFSGCSVAVQLAHRAAAPLSLGLFEPGSLGRGAAYGTQHREHLLNTRARMMSLFSDDPDQFVRWLGPRGGPSDFVSRRLYGDYVGDAARTAFERRDFIVIGDRAARLQRDEDGFTISSASGMQARARSVVLATGNLPPNDEFLPREIRNDARYVRDPWRFDYRGVSGDVLLIGSGLTALDVLVALKAGGHRGAVHIVSRHGRFPQAHADVEEYDVVPALDARNARSLLRSLRRHISEAARRGFDWRAVIDALRPESEALWRRLSPAERRRFERHLRSHWERRRHRAPQQVDAVRAEYERAGRLFVYAGRIGARLGGVTVAQRNGETVELHPDWIVNCAGLGSTRAMARDPLLGSLLAQGLISSAPNALGLRVSEHFNAIDVAGRVAPGLWVVGPLVRGSRFEATAVPEIRAMSESVAGQILQQFERVARLAFRSC